MRPSARPSSTAFASLPVGRRQLSQPGRQVGEAVGERLEVLLDEQRRRDEHRDLLYRPGNERGAERTSVLPKPTSPHTRRSIGLPVTRSLITASTLPPDRPFPRTETSGEGSNRGHRTGKHGLARGASRRGSKARPRYRARAAPPALRLVPLPAAELVQRAVWLRRRCNG